MTGTAEALQLGVDNGLDPAVLSNIMLKSSGANWSLEKYNPYPGVMATTPASNNYNPGFMVKLMQKDLGLAMAAAATSSSKTPMGAMANKLYGEHSNDATCNLDFSSILKLYQNK
jgi:3-hydroxyisobutyrate dehydrogenase